MIRTLLNGKIHRATVTESNIDYIGSITIDETLMKSADIIENEKVSVVNLNNGNRLETYVIKGEANSGNICLNGAAAKLCEINDKIIIMSYVFLENHEIIKHNPKVVFVDEKNRIIKIKEQENHSSLY